MSSVTTIKRIMKNNDELLITAQKLTGENIEKLQEYYENILTNKDLHNHINRKFSEFDNFVLKENLDQAKCAKDNPAGRLNRESQDKAGFLLYVLVRTIKPEIVVETGVSSGESSTFILQGLEDNHKGKLHSIDLPPEYHKEKKEIIFPPGKNSGWIIPDNLRHRWELSLGSSKDLLLPLLKKLKKIDIFFHDSLHTYEHMMFEFQTSWDFLQIGGLILSDDVATLNEKGRSPLVDFADIYKQEFSIFNLLGGLKKS